MQRQQRRSQTKQRGFNLIEILATVFILAIGLLGIAAVQLMAKRSNFESAERTTASMLAYDIMERMRANPAGLKAYAGSVTTQVTPLGGGTITSAPTPDCASTTCDFAELVAYDRYQWEQVLDGALELSDTGDATGGLVSPTLCVYTEVDELAVERSGKYSVAIAWRGSTELSDPTNPAGTLPTPDPYVCGRGATHADGTKKYDGTKVDGHRRILVVDSYILDPTNW